MVMIVKSVLASLARSRFPILVLASQYSLTFNTHIRLQTLPLLLLLLIATKNDYQELLPMTYHRATLGPTLGLP